MRGRNSRKPTDPVPRELPWLRLKIHKIYLENSNKKCADFWYFRTDRVRRSYVQNFLKYFYRNLKIKYSHYLKDYKAFLSLQIISFLASKLSYYQKYILALTSSFEFFFLIFKFGGWVSVFDILLSRIIFLSSQNSFFSLSHVGSRTPQSRKFGLALSKSLLY